MFTPGRARNWPSLEAFQKADLGTEAPAVQVGDEPARIDRFESMVGAAPRQSPGRRLPVRVTRFRAADCTDRAKP